MAAWLGGVGVETAFTGVPLGAGGGVAGGGVATAVATGFGVGLDVGAGAGAPDGCRAWSELGPTISEDSSTASNAAAGTPFSWEIMASY